METLSIRTDFPSIQGSDFSVLPSPSTFFSLSNNTAYPSPTFDQYPISATDYHQHFLPPPPAHHDQAAARPEEAISLPLSSSQSSLSDSHDTPSPASSFPSTPTGSPIPQNLVIEHSAGGEKQQVPTFNSKLDSSVQFEMFEDNFRLSQQQSQLNSTSNGFEQPSNFPPPVHHNYQYVGNNNMHYGVQMVAQPQAQYYSSGGGVGDGIVYVNGVPQYIPTPQQQPQAIPYSLAQGGGGGYAVPHAAPGPAAIETPHGTYYFVPNVNLAQQAPQSASPPPTHHQQHAHSAIVNEPVQLPSPPSQTGSPPLELSLPTSNNSDSSNPYAGFVQLPNGLTAGVAIAQATTPAVAKRSASGATATVVIGDQKIRLPVGQGKKGSTKRPAKKDQVKKFICPHPGCGRGFARNFNMQSHHKSHLGIREFDCPHCPKKFSRRHDRARHCSAVHDSRVDRDGNVTGGTGGNRTGSSISSGTPSSAGSNYDGEEYDDSFDEDKNFQLAGYAG
ncbi:hypothetical protein JCM3765_005291 [Sporobolomyces pararoseus]